MSDIDEIRKAFYDESDPFTQGFSSSSSATAVGPARSVANSSSAGASTSSRPAPYHRSSSTTSRASGSHYRGKGKGRYGGDASSSTAWERSSDDAFFDRAGGDGGRGGYGVEMRTQDIADADVDMDVDAGARAQEGVRRREEEENNVQKLLRAWRNERHAPDVLPTKDELLGNVLDSIRRQMHDVNAIRATDDLTEEDHYMMMLVQTEVERIKFVVRSYVRARLYKIERLASYILSDENKEEMQPRLTVAELRHVQQYGALIASHFSSTVLNHLPESQRAMDDEVPTFPSMTTEPDKNKPVFFHALENCGQVILPDGTAYQVMKGSIHLMRYHTIEHLLLRDEIELV